MQKRKGRPIKELIDKSVKYYGKLEGKVGGAFTSCQRIGGRGETTLPGIINAFLVHGMIIQGGSKSSHYGPVAIGSPDNIACEECKRLGKKVVILVEKYLSLFNLAEIHHLQRRKRKEVNVFKNINILDDYLVFDLSKK